MADFGDFDGTGGVFLCDYESFFIENLTGNVNCCIEKEVRWFTTSRFEAPRGNGSRNVEHL